MAERRRRLTKLVVHFLGSNALILIALSTSSIADEQILKTEECASRAAIAARIAKVESEKSPARAPTLLAQLREIEAQNSKTAPDSVRSVWAQSRYRRALASS